jgi:hypothetical protein
MILQRARIEHTVEIHHRKTAVYAKLDVLKHSLQLGQIERGRNDAGERAVRRG